jgi:imidazole glycerol-phosphate synthase subunit HisH
MRPTIETLCAGEVWASGQQLIAVVDYGIGNLRSAEKALGHLGADARLVSDPDEVSTSSAVVLPGVGAFGRCSEALKSSGLEAAVLDALGRGVPFLGICIGFQLLFEGSDEDPAADGLGVLSGVVRALPESEKRPQMQWNRLHRTGTQSRMLDGLDEEPWAYFVHSYAPIPAASSAASVIATCDYGGEVVAAVESGTLWGTQFHPEKSSRTGLALLANFVASLDDTGQPGQRL